MKLAGRDAGQVAVIVDVLDHNMVVIDGQVRRRKCNVAHLEPTGKKVHVEKDSSHNHVVAALKTLGIEVVERKTKKQKSTKPVQVRKGKVKPVAPAKVAKPAKAAPAAKPAEKKAAPAAHTAKK
jgi:large subunit ribosomal protein L14e